MPKSTPHLPPTVKGDAFKVSDDATVRTVRFAAPCQSHEGSWLS